MSRPCSICTHEQRATIEQEIHDGRAYRAIGAAYGISKDAVGRHKQEHMQEAATTRETTPLDKVEAAMPATRTMAEAEEELSPLTTEEADLLTHHEAIIEKGLQSFVEVGLALTEIRERRLYRAHYQTFEQYLDQRWHMSRFYGHRVMNAADVVRRMLPVGNMGTLPANEAQARELAAVPAEQRQEIWETAVQTAPAGKVTATHIKNVVRQKLGKPTGRISSAHPKVTPRKPRRVQVQDLLYEALTLMADDEAMLLLREFWAGVRSLVTIKGAKDPVKTEQITKLLAEVAPLLDADAEASA